MNGSGVGAAFGRADGWSDAMKKYGAYYYASR